MGGAKRAFMTEAEYRELIQRHVGRARRDQYIAEQLVEEAPAALRGRDRRAAGDGLKQVLGGRVVAPATDATGE